MHGSCVFSINFCFVTLLLTLKLPFYRAAAMSLAKRHADGSLPIEDFNLELENQSGEKVQLGTENDQRYKILVCFLYSVNGTKGLHINLFLGINFQGNHDWTYASCKCKTAD